MSDRFITYVIIGVAFGFTQLWFAYWVVKLSKERQRILKARKAAAAAAGPKGRAATSAGGPTEPAGQNAPTAVGTADAPKGEAGPSAAGPP